MTDIYIAIGIMTMISGLLFTGSLFLYRIISPLWRKAIAVGVIGLILLHLCTMNNSFLWINLLPVKDVIIFNNLLIPLNGILCGFVWGNRTLSILRRSTAIGILMFLGYLPTIAQVYPCQVPYHNIWKDDVCIQSSYTSCVPAASATLLRSYAIETNEAQMARLCLTRYDGTPLLGLYRGMRIQTEDSIYQAQIGKATLKQLKEEIPLPVMVIMTLDKKTALLKPAYADEYGWLVDVSHAVVLFEWIDEQHVRVGDPSIGPEIWNIETLEDLWHGVYICLN